MKRHERALQELRDWTVKSGGGLEIHFAAHNPTVVANVPHPWQCTAAASGNTGILYHAYGVTMEDAVSKCHQRWSDQKHGYMWEDVNTEAWFGSPGNWQKYQEKLQNG